MKNILILFAIALLISSCSQGFNQEAVKNLEEFKKAKTILIENLSEIKVAVNFQEYDTLKQTSQRVIINSNKYYYQNTILKIKHNNLKKVLSLWNKKLIRDEGTIKLTKDSVIYFEIDSKTGFFSGINHYIIYDPKEKKGDFGNEESEIIKEQNFGNHWSYIIVKRYYTD